MMCDLSIGIKAGVAVYKSDRRSLVLGSCMAFEVSMSLEYSFARSFDD